MSESSNGAARGDAAGGRSSLNSGALRALALRGVSGEWTAEAAPPAGLLDPAHALRTLHWGRNYLWVAAWPGVGEVVVKQFRHDSLRARWKRRWRGSKARKSFVVARAMAAAGVDTPEPLLWAESAEPSGPAWYVCRFLAGTEARYPFRALAAGTLEHDFPQLTAAELINAAASTARRLHEARFWHRDLSAGNLLLQRRDGALIAAVVDLNRCRRIARVSLSQRLRDLARLPVHREEDQRALLQAYFTPGSDAGLSHIRSEGSSLSSEVTAPAAAWRLYRLYHRSFHGRHRLKNKLRGQSAPTVSGRTASRGLLAMFRPRRSYPHLPPPPAGAAARDRVVWDSLSDQPHQHASRADKLLVRARDVGPHLRAQIVAAAAAPRIWRRYRELMAGLDQQPAPFGKLGIGLRPYPDDPEALLAAVDELGVRHALIRLHPWQETHDDEEALARGLRERGIDILFALPQRRELVRDLPRWRRAVEELGSRFAPYAEAFQVGQAINRSKWGVWTLAEYRALLREAAAALAPHGVPIVGPGVIDFEPHATAAAVNWPDLGVRLHALASLLYVDRRGAPENKQLGFDALRKAALLRAIADTAKWCGPRSWVTEVNWPLREGPHSPAGRDVAVDEQTAAAYAVRYCTSLLESGLVERVYWWQLIARGYGLLVAEDGGLRRRPAFHALASLQQRLRAAPSR
ncbi:MAG TPA: lipopolysaccharide kinase InaA family protein [Thermoanaerobaculia bacterium]|nr:lipopolysaccharide kinase InaA family protein [Thermoanaerobaculia bacterium]